MTTKGRRHTDELADDSSSSDGERFEHRHSKGNTTAKSVCRQPTRGRHQHFRGSLTKTTGKKPLKDANEQNEVGQGKKKKGTDKSKSKSKNIMSEKENGDDDGESEHSEGEVGATSWEEWCRAAKRDLKMKNEQIRRLKDQRKTSMEGSKQQHLAITPVQEAKLATYVRDGLYRRIKFVTHMGMFTNSYPKIWEKTCGHIGIVTQEDRELFGKSVYRTVRKCLTKQRNYTLTCVKNTYQCKSSVSKMTKETGSTNHCYMHWLFLFLL